MYYPVRTRLGLAALLMLASLAGTSSIRAQTVIPSREREAAAGLEAIVRQALDSNPGIRAARERLEAARRRIGPAGAGPDPVLMLGVRNFPFTSPGFSDFMTMKMVGLSQTFLFPGKLGLRRRAAEQETAAAEGELEAARRGVVRDAKAAYYDLAYLDAALEILERHRVALAHAIRSTEARYATGSGGQQDILRARVEAARLGEEASALREERRARLAHLNAVLDRPSEQVVPDPAIPTAVLRAAVADSASRVRFASAGLGARAAGSPFPPLETLQNLAIRRNPMLQAHEARIAAQGARVLLARREHLPNVDVSLSFAQRDGFTDMMTAVISLPLPLQKGRKQGSMVTAEERELAALHAEHLLHANQIRADVARLAAELERSRSQLALYKRAVLPQAHGTLQATLAGFQVGRADFLSLLDAQTTLFNYETAYYRGLSEFAKSLAELERVVGAEVLP